MLWNVSQLTATLNGYTFVDKKKEGEREKENEIKFISE